MPTDQLRIGKYVIVKNQPILFPLELVHSDVVNNAQSAGFFILQVTGLSVEVYCWGESASLNLKSDEAGDARLIRDFVKRVSGEAHPVSSQGHLMV